MKETGRANKLWRLRLGLQTVLVPKLCLGTRLLAPKTYLRLSRTPPPGRAKLCFAWRGCCSPSCGFLSIFRSATEIAAACVLAPMGTLAVRMMLVLGDAPTFRAELSP